MHVYTRPWWTVASAVAKVGWDVSILDPDAEEGEVYHDGDPNKGIITVTPHPGLSWVMVVVECEPDEEDE